jgi:hypothetical protein
MNPESHLSNLGDLATPTISGRHSQPTLLIEDALISLIEKCHYPRPYIMKSLNNEELNHVTTFYYLLQTPKEF